MPVRAHQRLIRTRYYIMTAVTVTALAAIMYKKFGLSGSAAILQAFGTISITFFVGAFIFEKWLWKTRLGRLIGCPPDYSGIWEGTIEKTIKSNPTEEDIVRISVEIKQDLIEIEWHQIGYNKNGDKISESHLLFGEVIDNQRKWGSICGMYEVTRKDRGHTKHYGSQLVDISIDGNNIDGSYCSNVGNAGNIKLTRAANPTTST